MLNKVSKVMRLLILQIYYNVNEERYPRGTQVTACRETLDLDVLRFFFDPHPGFAGAAIPIPAEVKKVADQMNGAKTSLRKAVARIQAVTSGKVSIKDGWIALELNRRHFFRVISFTPHS